MTNQISREELLNFTHQLHNKLRGAKGIKLTGLPALNEIENIFLFRFIEERKEIKINNDISFTTICEKYASDEKIREDKKIPLLKDRNCFKLWCEFYDLTNNNCILRQYHNNDIIHKYITSSVQRISAFTEHKGNLSQTIQELFNMVYNKFKNVKFNSEFYDMFGASHEEFKTNAHGNGGKHTGQHFTPMDIKRLVVEELKIKSIEIYYEPCAGTGGFIHTIDKYVRDNEGDKASKKFKNNIYANECNPEITKPLMINMLLHDIPVDNIHEQDSLTNENCIFMKNKVDVIATNYPFGMSNTIELSDYTDKKYFGCLIRGKNIIKNSTGQFIMHIYHSLKENGRAGFVSDRGILNNGDEKSWEHDLRKFLIENTNLYKIWLLPTGVFPYTNFATCVIFIKKGEKTKEVKIYNGKFKDEKNKSGLYIENESTKIFTRKELEKNEYSLKMEEKKEKIKKDWVKLGDVVEFEKKSYHKAGDAIDNGKYPYYTSSSVIKKSNFNDYINECIILGTGGSANINIDKNFSCSADNFIINLNNKNILLKYIYYYLKINIYILNEGFIGNGLKHLSKEYTQNIQIPSLSLQHQQEIVDFLDEQFKLYDINLLAKLIKDMPLFNLLIDKEYELFADALHLIYRKMELDALHLIYRKMELDALHTKMEKDKKAVFNIRVGGLDCKKYKLGDIVEIERGKSLPKTNIIDGKYPIITGCSDIKNYHNEHNFNGKDYIFMARVGSAGNILIYDNKCYLTDLAFALKCNNKKILKMFGYYYLKYNNNEIKKIIQTNGPPNINGNNLKDIFINVPSLEDQEKIIKQIEEIESEQSSYKKYGDMLQEQIDSISKLIENIAKNNKEDSSSESESESKSDSEEEIKPKKKSKHNKKESSDSDSEEEIKPKKKSKHIKKESSDSDSEEEEIKPKKKVKSKNITSSEEDTDTEEEIKPKKKVKSKNITTSSEDTDSEEEIKPIKKVKSK